MNIIEAKDLVHEFFRRDEEGNIEGISVALDKVDLNVKEGQFISILGHNGSGKSTLAKHINALLTPSDGTIYVDGKDTSKPENELSIRQSAGMVFQNPDNQIVSSIVEDDVAFGPENLGIEPERIRELVDASLEAVKMGEYRNKGPHMLSGGQKQRIAIARALVKKPPILIFDDSTSALDFKTEAKLRAELNKHMEGATVITIAQRIASVLSADRIIVLENGEIVERGNHDDLIALKGRYYQLYTGKAELD